MMINTLRHLQNPMEPVSYKRSKAILARLQGDDQLVTKKLSEVRQEIEKADLLGVVLGFMPQSGAKTE
ncbi:hypothetical protein [Virgibacillus sp. SK37]|uniref:hypothetical protein n=1 Tax=Virgibacillus sp. SK37 TaxID=403957 RepID=UPI0004D0D346|nr:hypothetical protein [Virgibacillus sp. SK37]AIF45057.1 hypothetical protein X953_00870 [Virgibacillus sp. SK37]